MNLSNKVYWGLVTGALCAAATMLEGTRHVPYKDVADVWTVCQGYAGKNVIRDKVYSDSECSVLLKTQLAEQGKEMLRCVNVPISKNEYEAYTLFTYNVGGHAFCTSSLLRKLNNGDHVAACKGLMAWVYADGKFVQGLANRRKFEMNLCLRNDDAF